MKAFANMTKNRFAALAQYVNEAQVTSHPSPKRR